MKAPLFLDETNLLRLLNPERLSQRMRESLAALAIGAATHSSRHVMGINGGAFGMMAGMSPAALGAKLVCVLPGNEARGLNPHQGIVALFDSETGACLAVGDAATITALRTAATSAAATEALSREESSVLTIVGSGLQAELHATRILRLRPIIELRIVARDPVKAKTLKEKLAASNPSLKIQLHAAIEAALPGTDILCLCTAAQFPYLTSAALHTGLHVNAVGACRPGHREIDLGSDASGISFFVESLSAAREEAEELKGTFADTKASIVEIGNVFAGRHHGRKHQREITFFKSVGIGLEDAEALRLAYDLHRTLNPSIRYA